MYISWRQSMIDRVWLFWPHLIRLSQSSHVCGRCRRSFHCSRLWSAKLWSPLVMLWDWEHRPQRDVAKRRRNITAAEVQPSSAVSGRSIHPIFHPFFKSRVSIYGFCLNEFFPPAGNQTDMKGTKPDSGKTTSTGQLTPDCISELDKDGRRKNCLQSRCATSWMFTRI